MACLLAPAGAAIITTVCRKKIPGKYHINWLNYLLWGGVAGLALEHVAHGEIVPFPPYLTAMENPADTAAMLHEIMTIGVTMLIACVSTWIIMVLIASLIEARSRRRTCHTTLLN